MAILCSRRELRGYKRRATKAFPKEYLELLFGTIRGDRITVEKSVHIPQCATRFWVNWKSDDQLEDTIVAMESVHGLEFVGTIHSHTISHELSHIPSDADNDSAHHWEERVFAIDIITKRKGKFQHKIAFFEPQQPLHEVAYF